MNWLPRKFSPAKNTRYTVSIDNLNFKMKFAGGTGAKKQLDLLTGQVNNRTSTCEYYTNSLKGAVLRCMGNKAHAHYLQ